MRNVYSIENSYRFFIPGEAVIFIAIMAIVAWTVADVKADKPGERGRAARCFPNWLRARLTSARERLSAAKTGIKIEELLEIAEKILDVCKMISILYLFLSASSLTNMVCETPSILLNNKPGWGVTTAVAANIGGSRIFAGHWRHYLNYTTQEYHAVLAMSSAGPNLFCFWALLAVELMGFTFSLVTWAAAKREGWAIKYAVMSFCIAIVWSAYESQAFLSVTLHDNNEEFFCSIPFLNVVCRALSYLHLLIAGFYFGIAFGKGHIRTVCSRGTRGKAGPATSSHGGSNVETAASTSANGAKAMMTEGDDSEEAGVASSSVLVNPILFSMAPRTS